MEGDFMITDAFRLSYRRLFRRISIQTLVTGLCLAVILASLLSSLNGMVEELNVPAVGATMALAMFLGWFYAERAMHPRKAIPYLASLGIVTGVLLAGNMVGKIFSLALSSLHLGWASLRYTHQLYWLWRVSPPDPSRASMILMDLNQVLATTLIQAGDWISRLIQRMPQSSTTATTLMWCLVMWACCAWLAWFMKRKNQPLVALLPVMTIMMASLAYSRTSAWQILPILAATFLLFAWCGYGDNENRWACQGIDYASDLRRDVILYATGLSILIIGMAILGSTFSVHKVIEAVRDIQSPAELGSLGQAVGLQPGSQADDTTGLATVMGEMPRQRLLGASPELLENPVMIVYTDDPPPDPSNTAADLEQDPYYWRAATYDIYTGHGWATSPTTSRTYRANQHAIPLDLPNHRLERLRFEPIAPSGAGILAAGQLVTVDQDFQITWRSQDGDLDDHFDVKRVAAQSNTPGYTVQSLVPLTSQELLRQAGTEYPETIRQRYMQLPDELPDRILELADSLAVYAATPYDQALAIESYLRRYPYSLQVPEPPNDQDISDYFLFDLKTGYCDYYATAMVLLARATGLPARLSVGYASGQYDQNRGGYVVRGSNAHSWVEIYFPGIGWVEFEPTASQPPIQRPKTIPTGFLVASPGERPASNLFLPGWLLAFLALLACSLVVYRLTRWQRMAPQGRLVEWYRRIYRHGLELGIATSPGDTPDEFASKLKRRLENLFSHSRWRGILEPADQEIDQLIKLYEDAVYSTQPPDAGASASGRHAWQGLRWRLWLARFRNVKV